MLEMSENDNNDNFTLSFALFWQANKNAVSGANLLSHFFRPFCSSFAFVDRRTVCEPLKANCGPMTTWIRASWGILFCSRATVSQFPDVEATAAATTTRLSNPEARAPTDLFNTLKI